MSEEIPGSFPYEANMNIVYAVTLAGGFHPMADQSNINVNRRDRDGENKISISTREIGRGNAPNFALNPGDIIYVPESIF